MAVWKQQRARGQFASAMKSTKDRLRCRAIQRSAGYDSLLTHDLTDPSFMKKGSPTILTSKNISGNKNKLGRLEDGANVRLRSGNYLLEDQSMQIPRRHTDTKYAIDSQAQGSICLYMNIY